MLTVLATLSTGPSDDSRDCANVYTNLDAVGNAAGELNADPDNGVPIHMYEGVVYGEHVYAESAYLEVPYLGESVAALITLEAGIGPVHFGRLKVGLVAVDRLGNEQSGAAAETELTVNSSPRPATRFQRGDYAAGQQAFSFVQSPQLAA